MKMLFSALTLSLLAHALPPGESRDFAVVVKGKDSRVVTEITAALKEEFAHKLFVLQGNDVVAESMAAAKPGHQFRVALPGTSDQWKFEVELLPARKGNKRVRVTLFEKQSNEWRVLAKAGEFRFSARQLAPQLRDTLARLSFK